MNKSAENTRIPIRKGTVKGPLAKQIEKGKKVTVTLKKKGSRELLMERLRAKTASTRPARGPCVPVSVEELKRRETAEKAASLKPVLRKWAKKDTPGRQKQGPLNKKAAPLGIRGLVGQKLIRLLSKLGIKAPGKYVGGARKALAPETGMLPFPVDPAAIRSEAQRRLGQVGTAGAGAGALGAGGLGYALKGGGEPPKEASTKPATADQKLIGTPFMDGFLQCCLDRDLGGEQVADVLEKASAADGRLGEEAKGLMGRMAKTD